MWFLSRVRTSEVKLSVASLLSDRIVDEILESLSRSQHTLVGVLAVRVSISLSVCFFCPLILPLSVSRLIM